MSQEQTKRDTKRTVLEDVLRTLLLCSFLFLLAASRPKKTACSRASKKRAANMLSCLAKPTLARQPSARLNLRFRLNYRS